MASARRNPREAEERKIWVRRGGPREKEGLDAMRALKDEGFDIHVFDRNTPLTDIVDKALQTMNRG